MINHGETDQNFQERETDVEFLTTLGRGTKFSGKGIAIKIVFSK